jgi:putative oxidoreductase
MYGQGTYPNSGAQAGLYDDGGYSSQDTTVFSSDTPAYDALSEDETTRRAPVGWHAGADLGLLILRLVLGALFIAHAGQKLFGWFQGGGIDGTARFIESLGFTSNLTLLAWLAGLTELVGGTFVLLGLFTPAGAAAILGLMASAIWAKFNGNNFLGDVELESIYAAAAFTLLFAGPGRISLDRPTPWYRHASAFGVVFFLVAAGAAIAILTVFR